MQEQYFISFGDDGYRNSKQRIKEQAIGLNVFKEINIYGPDDYDDNFRSKFSYVLNQRKGAGYWIWKLYFIKKKLEQLKDGDFLIYCDSGCSINRHGIGRYNEYLNMLNNSEYGIISFKLMNNENDYGCIEKLWSIKELFNYFNISLDSEIGNTPQYVGGILIMQKKPHLNKILDEYLKLLEYDQKLITDYYSSNQINGFRAARHDQSIWSIIRKIYGSVVINLDETIYYSLENETIDWNNTKKFTYPFWATRIHG